MSDANGTAHPAGPVRVVAAALCSAGRVLAGRRSYPAAEAGRWELPGGKVRPGESDHAALRRELLEELGLAVHIGAQLGPHIPLPGGVLICYLAALRVPEGEPGLPSIPQSGPAHEEIRWLPAAQLDDMDWLDSDRALLGPLRSALRRTTGERRGSPPAHPSRAG